MHRISSVGTKRCETARAPLQCCSSLQQVVFRASRADLSERGIRSLAALGQSTSLKALAISFEECTGTEQSAADGFARAFGSLRHSRALESLKLELHGTSGGDKRPSYLSDAGAEALAVLTEIPNLREIDLCCWPSVVEYGGRNRLLQSLAAAPRLQKCSLRVTYSFWRPGLPLPDASALTHGFRALDTLSLDLEGFGDLRMLQYLRHLAHLPCLRSLALNLGGWPGCVRGLGPLEMAELGSLLRDLPALQDLQLGCQARHPDIAMGDVGMRSLAAGLECATALRRLRLDLSGNPLGQGGMRALATALASHRSLRCLSLVLCDTGPTDLVAEQLMLVCHAADLRSLFLDLVPNDMTEDGSERLKGAISGMRSWRCMRHMGINRSPTLSFFGWEPPLGSMRNVHKMMWVEHNISVVFT